MNFVGKEIPVIEVLFPNLTDLTKSRKKQSFDLASNNLTRNSKTTDNSNIVNLPTIPHIHENSTRLNHNKLYNCHENTYQKKRRRVRSVVRISRRSSEPCKETVPQTVIINPELNKTSHQGTKESNRLDIDWEGYREYLSNLNKSKKEIQNKLGYGKTYSYILETGNAQDLLKASNGCRVHAMRALYPNIQVVTRNG